MRRLVVKSTAGGLRLQPARPGAVHRGHRAEVAAAAAARPRTPSRSRATCAGSPGAAPTSTSSMLRFANFIGPEHPHRADRLLQPAGRPDRARLRRAAAVRARGRRPRGAAARDVGTDHGDVNVAGDGVLLLSQAARLAGRPALPVPPGARRRRRTRCSAAPGSPTSAASRCGSSPTAAASTPPGCGAVLGFEPPLHDPGGLRGLRPRPRGCAGPLSAERVAGRRAARARGARARSPCPVTGRARPRRAARADRLARRRPRRAGAGGGPGRPGSPPRGRAERRTTPARPSPTSRRRRSPARGRPSRRRSRTTPRPTAWPSCAAASPATTRSTSSASTPSSPTPCCMALAAPAVPALVPGRGARHREHPRRRAARSSSPTTPGTIALDSLMTSLAVHDEHPAHRFLRMLGADLVFQMPVPRRAGPQERRDARVQRRRRAAARRRRARRRVAGGLQGHRQAVQRAVQAAAVRPRRVRLGRPAHADADLPCAIVGAEEIYPILGNMPTAGPAARPAVLPDHADLPVARPARAGPAAEQVAHRVRRADRHRRATARAPPTTRCSSSTSPTRCARRSSRRSTACSCSAAPSSSDASLGLTRSAEHAGRTACIDQRRRAAPASPAPHRHRAHGAPAPRRPGSRSRPPCGRCGSPGPRQPCAFA